VQKKHGQADEQTNVQSRGDIVARRAKQVTEPETELEEEEDFDYSEFADASDFEDADYEEDMDVAGDSVYEEESPSEWIDD